MKDIFHDNFKLFFWFNEKKEFKNDELWGKYD